MAKCRASLVSLTTLLCCTLVCTQLVLDDLPEDSVDELAQGGASREATDPYTKILQWGVDNMDRSSVAEQAKAIREVTARRSRIVLVILVWGRAEEGLRGGGGCRRIRLCQCTFPVCGVWAKRSSAQRRSGHRAWYAGCLTAPASLFAFPGLAKMLECFEVISYV